MVGTWQDLSIHTCPPPVIVCETHFFIYINIDLIHAHTHICQNSIADIYKLTEQKKREVGIFYFITRGL